MAAIRDVEVTAIEAAHKSLVELSLVHQTTARVARKHAVKKLFGPLLASWEAGVPFDKMAAALNTSGIQITPETLRSYFFELKTAEQLQAESAAHARAMAKIRKDNDVKQRNDDLLHARELAQAGTELANNVRQAQVEAASQVATRAVEAARRGAGGAAQPDHGSGKNLGKSDTRRSAARPVPQDDRTEGGAMKVSTPAIVDKTPAPSDHSRMQQSRAAPVAKEIRLDQPDVTQPVPVASDGQAMTLEHLSKYSQGRQETPYVEDLVLREGDRVWFESGKPFVGYLSPRTLHTLRTVGRVIAPTEGRTAKDFVPMTHDL